MNRGARSLAVLAVWVPLSGGCGGDDSPMAAPTPAPTPTPQPTVTETFVGSPGTELEFAL